MGFCLALCTTIWEAKIALTFTALSLTPRVHGQVPRKEESKIDVFMRERQRDRNRGKVKWRDGCRKTCWENV